MLARCKDCEHGTYDAASSSCACEGNWAGPFCDRSCGGHGTSDGSSCICSGNFITRYQYSGESLHVIGEFCETECGCSGHGNQTAIEAARATGSCSAGSCSCEGNWVGQFCQDNCGDHGTGDGSTCTCEGNHAGELCQGSCGDHGTSDGSACTCESGYFGEFCEYQPLNDETVPAQCVAGMGSHGVVYNGTAYRTIDDAPPEGGLYGAPNAGCQRTCTEYYDSGWREGRCRTSSSDREPNYLPLPPGYTLAPPDTDTIAVIAAHGWSTECAVAAAGTAWYSTNGYRPGERCGSSNRVASSNGSHTVRHCIWESRVLARCP